MGESQTEFVMDWSQTGWAVYAAVLCALVLAIVAFILTGVFSRKRGWFIGALATLVVLGGTVYFPSHYLQTQGFDIKTIFMCLHSAIGLFVISTEYKEVVEITASMPQVVSGIYSCVGIATFVAMPLLTFGAIVYFIKNLWQNLWYKLVYKSEIYVFSELNDRSLLLATDLKNPQKKGWRTRKIVFCDVYDGGDEKDQELAQSAALLGATCVRNDIRTFSASSRWSKTPLHLFVVGKDEVENVNQSLSLVEKYKNRDNSHLYMLSNTKESEFLISSLDSNKLKVRRINEKHSLINHHLYDTGHRLFDSAIDSGDGEKVISVIVVGMGVFGTEMFRTLSWYCQMPGYKLKMIGLDSASDTESRLKAKCPDLFNPTYNKQVIEGDAYYDLEVKGGVNVDSEEFVNIIKSREDVTYIFVALGSDELSIRTAANLRAITLRMGKNPIIDAVVQNDKMHHHLNAKHVINGKEIGLCNFKGEEYDINFIGNMATMYSEKNIISSQLEEAGLARHKLWLTEPNAEDKEKMSDEEWEKLVKAFEDGVADFWRYEYNYHSSIATAIHIKARKHCKLPGAEKEPKDRTDEEKIELTKAEHNRWNAYVRSIGYVWSGSDHKNSRKDLAKRHNLLIPYDRLPPEEKKKDDV